MAERTLDELRLSFIELKRLIVEEYCDGNPSVLYAQAKGDEQLRRYCAELDGLATSLRRHELSAKGGFIAPVSDAYIQAWNDYRERWQRPVGKVQSYQLDPYIADAVDEIFGESEFQSIYKSYSEQEISKIETARFRFFLRDLRNAADDLDEESDSHQFLAELTKTFIELWKSTGFTLEGSDERAGLAPIALVSTKVANKVGATEERSLYELWKEARKAYILGLPLASMAMSRAILEEFLEKILNIEKNKLEKMIDAAAQKLGANTRRMHEVRQVGNAILHGLNEPISISGKKAIKDPTQEALKVLVKLKDLLETSAQRQRPRT